MPSDHAGNPPGLGTVWLGMQTYVPLDPPSRGHTPTRRRVVAILAIVALVLGTALWAVAQENAADDRLRMVGEDGLDAPGRGSVTLLEPPRGTVIELPLDCAC